MEAKRRLQSISVPLSLPFSLQAEWVMVGALLVLALGLRLYGLDSHSLWFDETASIEVAQRGLHSLLFDRFGWMQVQTPLHYFIVWLTIQPVDPTTTAALVRLPPALFGGLSVLVVYALGRDLFGRIAAFLGALFLALSPIHLNYSQDVRPYAQLTFFTLLMAFCLVRAEKSGSGKWWAAFAVSSALNIATSYNALTLVLPAFAPYIAWVAWRYLRDWAWARRNLSGTPALRAASRHALFLAGALAVMGVASLVDLVDLTKIPRTPPDLSLVSVSSLLTSIVELGQWFTTIGAEAKLESLLGLLLFLFVVVGVLRGLRGGPDGKRGVVLCLLFVSIPPPVLAVLGTTNVVYQRYALFVMPFYFLLIANGLLELVAPLIKRKADVATTDDKLTRLQWTALAIVALLSAVGPFVYGALQRNTTDGSSELVYRPDLRGAAAYLSASAKPDDAVIFAGWDPTVSYFYWHNTPPAKTFSATDPKIYGTHVAGTLYWVVSFDFTLPEAMQTDPHWTKVWSGERVAVYRETAHSIDLAASMEQFVTGLNLLVQPDRPTQQILDLLRGTVYQANGDSERAAAEYLLSNTAFPIGGEYLRTARGFSAHNDPERAWRDTLISKSMEPQQPDLHLWMAGMLRDAGLQTQSRVETEIASRLSRKWTRQDIDRLLGTAQGK